MRLLIITLTVIAFFISCKDKSVDKKVNTKELKEKVLKPVIEDVLKLYIKEYPIPQDISDSKCYYQITFNGDEFTLMRLSFPSPEMIDIELKGMFYYHDSIPISIFDKKYTNKSKYYNNYFNKDLQNKVFSYEYTKSYPETFPPIWKYRIFDENAFLIEKDTIWVKW